MYAIFWLVIDCAAAAALLVSLTRRSSPFPIYATHTAPSINLNLNIQNWKEKKLGRRSIHWKKITPPSPAYSLAIESSTQGGKLKSLSGKIFFLPCLFFWILFLEIFLFRHPPFHIFFYLVRIYFGVRSKSSESEGRSFLGDLSRSSKKKNWRRFLKCGAPR